MPKRLMGIHIREVEERLFHYLYEYKVATSLQIARDVYRGISHQALYKRLGLLIDAGLISANYFRELGGRLVYSLDRLGFERFIREGDKRLRREYRSASPLHDLDLVDIGQRLKTIQQGVGYIPENVIRTLASAAGHEVLGDLIQVKPDAILKVRFPKGEIAAAIEYERTLKYGGRYPGFFKKYYTRPEIVVVLLIGRDESVVKRLQTIERGIHSDKEPKVFYSTLTQITEAQNEALSFSNIKNERLRLT